MFVLYKKNKFNVFLINGATLIQLAVIQWVYYKTKYIYWKNSFHSQGRDCMAWLTKKCVFYTDRECCIYIILMIQYKTEYLLQYCKGFQNVFDIKFFVLKH